LTVSSNAVTRRARHLPGSDDTHIDPTIGRGLGQAKFGRPASSSRPGFHASAPSRAGSWTARLALLRRVADA